MKPSEHLQKHLITALVGLLTGVLGYTLRALGGDVLPPFLEHVLPSISKITLLWLSLTLFLMNIVVGTWLLVLLLGDKNARLKKKYRPDKPTNTYVHESAHEPRACLVCWPDGIRPLLEEPHGWRCPKCGQYFQDPSRKPPPSPRQEPRHRDIF